MLRIFKIYKLFGAEDEIFTILAAKTLTYLTYKIYGELTDQYLLLGSVSLFCRSIIYFVFYQKVS